MAGPETHLVFGRSAPLPAYFVEMQGGNSQPCCTAVIGDLDGVEVVVEDVESSEPADPMLDDAPVLLRVFFEIENTVDNVEARQETPTSSYEPVVTAPAGTAPVKQAPGAAAVGEHNSGARFRAVFDLSEWAESE